MIKRYQSDEFQQIWSDENRYQTFLTIELAVAKAWYNLGLYDYDTYQRLMKAKVVLTDIYEIEAETKHDVIAFTRAISKNLGEERKWIHYGLTSTDVVDSAIALILRDVNTRILDGIDRLITLIEDKALAYKNTLIIGRTQGIHAEVTSFGLKYVLWFNDLKRIKAVFIAAIKNVEVIKISGAVGNYAANTPKLEVEVAKILAIDYALISTQVLQRDRHANYISTIALLGSELEKIATEIRHLSRTEVGEVREGFSINQKGSSAMPHKKNPIASENISGLARVLRGYVVSAFENINLWHERDISHSSVERIILQDATTLMDYMLKRLYNVIDNLDVNEDKMLKNIELTNGVVFSQHVLTALINKKMNREDAYDLVQTLAYEALNTQSRFKELLMMNEKVSRILTNEEIDNIFDMKELIKHVDVIYQRVLKKEDV